ncbi:MAG: (2Fe-2S)-binding protein [Oligoflexales bacterium]|nr:(2Fe-2S)-binding protein [Oligoflexales bacterium]
MPRVVIVSQTQKLEYEVRAGFGFQALCAKHQTPIEYDCRAADCGICIFSVTKGLEFLSPKTPAEADFLRAMRAQPEERLACQTRILGDVEILLEFN